MPHFMKLCDPDSLGALHFTDADMKPIERTMTIKAISRRKPPGGGKERPYFTFSETPLGAFFAVGQIKRLALALKCSDTDKWIGVKIVVTCDEVQDPRTGGKCMGMIIVRAARPKPDDSRTATSGDTRHDEEVPPPI
jgi:hypothetical protein